MPYANLLLSVLFNTRPARLEEYFNYLTQQPCILLAPRWPPVGSQEDISIVVDEEFIASHIIKMTRVFQPKNAAPPTHREEYTTLNNKTVIIRSGSVLTNKGFRKPVLSRFIGDDIIYDSVLDQSFIVYYIEKPLTGIIEPTRTDNLEEITSFRRILDMYPEISQEVSFKLEQMIMAFNDSSIMLDDVRKIREQMKSLLKASYHILDEIDKTLLTSMLEECFLSVDAFYQLFENFIMEQTYDIVFFKIAHLWRPHDAKLSEMIQQMQALDISQVGMPAASGHSKRLLAAVDELHKLGAIRQPMEKLDCIMRTIKALTNGEILSDSISEKSQIGSDKSILLSGDSLVPLLLLTVIRSGVTNLLANVDYIKNFIFEQDVTSSLYGYSISTLEGVVSYIQENHEWLAALSRQNELCWEAIRKGNIAEIKPFCQPTVLSQSEMAHAFNYLNFEGRRGSEERFDPLLPAFSVNMTPTHAGMQLPPVIYTRDHMGNNALLMAVQHGHIELAHYLINEMNFSPKTTNYKNRTPLIIAVSLNQLDLVEMLLKGADSDYLNMPDASGDTALSYCVRANASLEVAKRLLEAGADQTLRNNTLGYTALMLAAKQKRDELFISLLERAPLIALNQQDNEGRTLLHVIQNTNLLQKLVLRGADVNLRDLEGKTPLLSWVSAGNFEVVQFFLNEDQVDKEACDYQSQTALHLACTNSYTTLVKLLLEHLPSRLLHLRTIHGLNPFHMACQVGSLEIVNILLEHGASPTDPTWDEGLLPSELTDNVEIRTLVDNFSLFAREQLHVPANRICAVVRAEVDRTNPLTIQYIIKSGIPGDLTSVTTIPRTLENFRFLRQQILYERPEACIPTLDNMLEPWQLSARPSRSILHANVRRLDKFLNYLLEHPQLMDHELVWEFILVGDLQSEMIIQRSRNKLDALLDDVFDNYSPEIEQVENEERYFEHVNQTVLLLKDAVKKARNSCWKMERCSSERSAHLTVLARALDKQSMFEFPAKKNYTSTLKRMALALKKRPEESIEMLKNELDDFMRILDGSSVALRVPRDLLSEYIEAQREMERHKAQVRRREFWFGRNPLAANTTWARGKVGEAEQQVYEDEVRITHKAQVINYRRQTLADELAHLQGHHEKTLMGAIDFYARKQLKLEKEILKVMENIWSDLNGSSGG
ncbi:uncharacterized protein VTP21DRAFT_10482 [Calcarisporiella thermophila]|uniref:uncharacterized protein n=1 Tax=Calcarisporiella thermophila TaxID=911321 RepID=UPI0037425DC7